MTKLFSRFAKDESGATAIEYGLLGSLIALAIIATVRSLGTTLSDIFGRITAGIA